MNRKIMGLVAGLCLSSIVQANAQTNEYSRGYNDGFNAGIARCGGNGGGGGGQPPAQSFEARCVPVDTGYGARFELRLRSFNSGSYLLAANSDGQGTEDNRRYCQGAIDDLRVTRYRYLCAPVRVERYGNRFELLKIENTGSSLYSTVIQTFDGQGSERNLNNCRAELRYQP